MQFAGIAPRQSVPKTGSLHLQAGHMAARLSIFGIVRSAQRWLPLRLLGRAALAALLLALAACGGRPLSDSEQAFAADIIGDELDTGKVRVAAGFGPSRPSAAPTPPVKAKRKTVPGACARVPQGPRTEPPPGFALRNRIHLRNDLYRDDLAPGWPDRILVPQSFVLAHELVHVWQWQNRQVTGYRPLRAFLEGLLNVDPYYYRPAGDDAFLGFGYEQQAALVEDYFCHVLFDPGNPRRADLRAILAPHFPLDRLDAALAR